MCQLSFGTQLELKMILFNKFKMTVFFFGLNERKTSIPFYTVLLAHVTENFQANERTKKFDASAECVCMCVWDKW